MVSFHVVSLKKIPWYLPNKCGQIRIARIPTV